MKVDGLFEDFGRVQDYHESLSDAGKEEAEDNALASFEKGYTAGWDDAVAAQNKAGAALAETVQQSLQDVQFTREEAIQAFVAAARPLFETIIAQVLPVVANASFGAHIASLLENALEEASNLPIEIQVSEDQFAAVESALSGFESQGISLRRSDNLAAGQACFRLGDREELLDLNGLQSEIHAAVESFLVSVQKDV